MKGFFFKSSEKLKSKKLVKIAHPKKCPRAFASMQHNTVYNIVQLAVHQVRVKNLKGCI